jgi:hypothetical protein
MTTRRERSLVAGKKKETAKRLDDIDVRLDELDVVIERVERSYESITDYWHSAGDDLPYWLVEPYDEQAKLIAEYRNLSPELRHGSMEFDR